MTRTILLLTLLSVAASSAALASGSAQLTVFANSTAPKARKVLFIGNSMLYTHEVPRILVGLMTTQQSTSPLKVREITGNSFTLQDYLADGTADKQLAAGGPWDEVIVAEKSSRMVPSYPRPDPIWLHV